ncbi:MAG: tetratricopeptide repeat protein [Parafilimonas sp.]
MRIFLIFFLIGITLNAGAQKQRFDSLSVKYVSEKADSNKVTLLWQMAEAVNLYNPDSSVAFAQRALYLAKKIKYINGESLSLGVLATAFTRIGNYPKALEFYLQKLELEESRNSPRDLASALINIGILYVFQEQYHDALTYYKNADSVIRQNNVTDLRYFIYLNLGDVYEKLDQIDSSFKFYNKSLSVAIDMRDTDYTGTSMVGLGHIYLKKNNLDSALKNYLQAITFLKASDDVDVICEASLGLAKLYGQRKMNDSAAYYATLSFDLAQQSGFESRQLDAAAFLTDYFKETGDIKNALKYSEALRVLNDSVYSKEKIRESQVISSNEQLRQNEIAENKIKEEEERHAQLQMLMIGIFIVLFFLITLMLNRVKVHYKIIKFFGIISLLMMFEYILLFLNPWIGRITDHAPIFEILIFVAIASILTPTHHKIEHWLIQRLTNAKVFTKEEVKAIEATEAEEDAKDA